LRNGAVGASLEAFFAGALGPIATDSFADDTVDVAYGLGRYLDGLAAEGMGFVQVLLGGVGSEEDEGARAGWERWWGGAVFGGPFCRSGGARGMRRGLGVFDVVIGGGRDSRDSEIGGEGDSGTTSTLARNWRVEWRDRRT